MSREQQLLARVLGDSGFAATHLADQDVEHFSVWSVALPSDRYRGFPPLWRFALLRRAGKMLHESEVLRDADRVVTTTTPEQLLVLVSDAKEVDLRSNLGYANRTVFFIDLPDLPASRERSHRLQLEPLKKSIRRRMSRQELSLFRLTPYQKGQPATGWRFYGRKRELELLMDTPQSFVVVGGRRIGKTSLMLEARDRLKSRGETTYFLSVEECKTASEVVRKLLTQLSARDVASALRHSETLDERLLTVVLKRITAAAPVTLFLDELGNVLVNLKEEQEWQFLGILRQLYHQGRLRYIISCFQEEFFLKQEAYEGPLINFATTMRLGPFSRTEAEDLVLVPLELWRPVGRHRQEIEQAVLSKVGQHPLLLQTFCYDLFERLARKPEEDVLAAVNFLLGLGLFDCFRSVMDEVFWRRGSSTLNYLFLKRCVDADRDGRPLLQSDLDEEWVQSALRTLGYEAALVDRHNLLQAMEVRGLTARLENTSGERQMIIAPVIYHYFRNAEPKIERFLERLADDIRLEAADWHLQRLAEASGA